MYLLFDIGGTKTRFGVSEDGEKVTGMSVINTPLDFDTAMKAFSDEFSRIIAERNVEAVAGGIAGVLDEKKRALVKSPNLTTWENKPLGKSLEQTVGLKVLLENDADLAGLGEVVMGAGRSFRIVAYITIGTGIGGTRIVNGEVDERVYGFEPGHQILDAGGSILGKVSSFEELASGSGIKRRYKMTTEEIKDGNIWDQVTKYIAYGLHNTILHWSPEIIVMGGGLIESGAISMETLNVYVSETMKVFPEVPKIVKSELGEASGLYGALQKLKGE